MYCTLFHKLRVVRQRVLGHAKARHVHQNKVVLPLATKHVLKNKFCDRASLEYEEKLDSFDIATSFKNRGLQSDTVLKPHRAPYWRQMSVALTTLHGITGTRCSYRIWIKGYKARY